MPLSESPVPEEKGPTFDPRVHWCARHLEPFRENWPEGWMPAMLAIFEVCVRREDILAATGGQTNMLHRVLLEYSPLCCLVGDETAAKWTKLALGESTPFLVEYDALRASR